MSCVGEDRFLQRVEAKTRWVRRYPKPLRVIIMLWNRIKVQDGPNIIPGDRLDIEPDDTIESVLESVNATYGSVERKMSKTDPKTGITTEWTLKGAHALLQSALDLKCRADTRQGVSARAKKEDIRSHVMTNGTDAEKAELIQILCTYKSADAERTFGRIIREKYNI